MRRRYKVLKRDEVENICFDKKARVNKNSEKKIYSANYYIVITILVKFHQRQSNATNLPQLNQNRLRE